MNGAGQQVLPVVISILILILIAVLRGYSTTVAALTATMPVMIPLALWIIYAGEDGDTTVTIVFLETMVLGASATLISVIAMWLAARAGWSLASILVACYGAWGVVLGAYAFVTRVLLHS